MDPRQRLLVELAELRTRAEQIRRELERLDQPPTRGPGTTGRPALRIVR